MDLLNVKMSNVSPGFYSYSISLTSAIAEKRTLKIMNPLHLILTLAALLLTQIASGFIVIESDYPEYDDYPQPQLPSRFPAQQSQEIRCKRKFL